MSEADREKWDTRYREGSYEARNYASPFLESWLPKLPATLRGMPALDVACGAGRNALRLAEAGFAVDAMDISAAALARAAASAAARGLQVNWIEADLDHARPTPGHYALISVIRFTDPLLHPHLAAALAPHGWLLYEHHLRTPRAVGGPTSERFRVAPQQLLRDFASLRVVHYEEGIDDDPDGRTMALVRLVACNGDPGF
jgi:SAM-dependent methyltransferase